MVSNSAKLDSRTKQHTQSGVSTSDGSRDIVEKNKKIKKIKNNCSLKQSTNTLGVTLSFKRVSHTHTLNTGW